MPPILPPPLDLVAIERDGIPKPKWIVEPYVAQGDLVVVVADGNTGKTFLALDMAIGLAQGRDVLGRQPPDPQRVLYIDEDSSVPQITRRMIALAAGRETTFATLGEQIAVYSSVGFRLDTPDGRDLVNQALARHAPQIVVFDAFRAFHAYGEENNAEMAGILRHVLRPLCTQHGVTVILIHHTNKESEESATKRKVERDAARATRGGTEIRNAADCLLYIERRGGAPTIYLDKTRWTEDADRPDPLRFIIRNTDEAGAIRIQTTAIDHQPKMRAAKLELAQAISGDREISVTEMMNTLDGFMEGRFGRSTLLRALALLEEAGTLAHRKEGRSTLWRRVGEAPAPDPAISPGDFDAAAPEAE